MKIVLGQNAYGKNAVNLSKITRFPDHHEFRQISVNVVLEGDFESAHTAGDNTALLPTDTQKNTVYALAKDHFSASIEEFGMYLADHFFNNNPHVSRSKIQITEHLYIRASFDGNLHPHAFIANNAEKHTAEIIHDQAVIGVTAGISGLLVLKTTGSGFENYIKDQYTTLKETNDRILATECEAEWDYQLNDLDFSAKHGDIRLSLINTFSHHQSLSLQQTMFAMGENVLKENEEVREIRFKMPNKHHILFNLEQFGMDNNNEIFIATDEPYGYITGTVTREE
ncbi:MAG: factor-independent urate hydroxylase [Chitinophagaceae bacterium]